MEFVSLQTLVSVGPDGMEMFANIQFALLNVLMAIVLHLIIVLVTLDGLVIPVILILMNVMMIMVDVIKRVPTLMEVIIAHYVMNQDMVITSIMTTAPISMSVT
jgi:hypothetical protein